VLRTCDLTQGNGEVPLHSPCGPSDRRHWVKPPRRDRRSSTSATVFQVELHPTRGSLARHAAGQCAPGLPARRTPTRGVHDRYSPSPRQRAPSLSSCAGGLRPNLASTRRASPATRRTLPHAVEWRERPRRPPSLEVVNVEFVFHCQRQPAGCLCSRWAAERMRSVATGVPIALPAVLPNLNALTCSRQWRAHPSGSQPCRPIAGQNRVSAAGKSA
jgi:hypothetical protein